MHLLIHHRTLAPEAQNQYSRLVRALEAAGATYSEVQTEVTEATVAPHPDFALSVGGDGTLLSTVHLVRHGGIPVVGVNFGHLGFLTTVGQEVDVRDFVRNLFQGRYQIEPRTLLHLDADPSDFALNEVSLHRREEDSLLRVNLYVDDHFVATYDGDGLIVATPTGSTAYSLSCGGPILTPDSGCFAVTPIGAHTLTLRPIIVPDTARIRLEPSAPCTLGVDSTLRLLPAGRVLTLTRETFTVPLVRMQGQSFFTAIHEKLAWGTGLR